MSEKYEQLRAMSDDELVARHDQLANNSGVGVSFYLDELSRRRADRLTARIGELLEEGGRQSSETLELTKVMKDMTEEIRLLTYLAVSAAICSVILAVYATFFR